jgi:hypothetical protein
MQYFINTSIASTVSVISEFAEKGACSEDCTSIKAPGTSLQVLRNGIAFRSTNG